MKGRVLEDFVYYLIFFMSLFFMALCVNARLETFDMVKHFVIIKIFGGII
jgi:hypothetical protein